ncbi:MAG: Gfo/Idh/MocA family oxidoreductase [Pirellula sp.]
MSNQRMVSNKKHRVGIIGAGAIATSCHLPVLMSLPNVRVEWITDVDASRSQAGSESFGIKRVDEKNLEDASQVDVVLLALPYGARKTYYPFCTSRGSAAYVEKPFARTLAEHHDICSWFPVHRLACGLQRRASGAASLLKQVISERLFGEVRRIKFSMGGYGTRGGGYSSNLSLAGGGVLFDHAIHGLDLALYCVAATSVEVQNVTMILDDGFDIHTAAQIRVITSEHSDIEFELKATCLEYADNRVHVEFEHAKLELDPYGSSELAVNSRNGKSHLQLRQDSSRASARTANQIFSNFWQNFLRSIETEVANFTSAQMSVVTTSCIDQLYSRGQA